jgi:hypothetical protein
VLADSRLDDRRHRPKGAAACWHRVTVSRLQATRLAEDEESRAACLTVRPSRSYHVSGLADLDNSVTSNRAASSPSRCDITSTL